MNADITETPDRQLLAEYVQTRSADAFGRIVGRYVDLVHSAALRQVGDAHLAEDVTQAVFLILCKRAGSIQSQTALGGWFLLTTRNVARNAMRREWRLKRRERKAAEMSPQHDPSLSAEARSVVGVLDEAITRLSDADRDVIVQRFFHSKSHREVGQALGLSEEAASKRVSRAMRKLRELLERSGVTASEATLMALLPVISLKPAPPALVASIQQSSASPGATALAAATGATLGTGAMVAIAAGAAVIVGVGILLLTQLRPGGPAAPPAPAVATANQRTITLLVLDPSNNEPVADALIETRFGGRNYSAAGKTDARGGYVISVPQDFANLSARISLQGRVPMTISWSNSIFRGGVPPVYSIPLEKGVTIGGRVVDAQGKPVAGAKVEVQSDSEDRGSDRAAPQIMAEGALTDAEGRWKYDNAPAKIESAYIRATHPDFPGAIGDHVSYANLRNQTALTTLNSNTKDVSGVVLGPDGRPIAGATVVTGTDRSLIDKATARTDAEGRFEIKNVSEWNLVLTATAKGFAPDLVNLREGGDPKAVQFHLGEPKTIEAYVVAANGSPMADARVTTDTWRGNRSLTLDARTDSAGKFTWTEAPADEVQISVGASGYSYVRNFKIKAGDPAPKITLYPMQIIAGRVIDAVNLEPIPQFKVSHGVRWVGQEDVVWQSHYTRSMTDGKYEASIGDFANGGKIKVEADGYMPAISRMIFANEGSVTIDLELQPIKLGPGSAGLVLDPQGNPAGGATVYSFKRGTSLYISESSSPRNNPDIKVSTTDPSGKFSLTAPDSDFNVLILADQGQLLIGGNSLPADGKLKLQPWARIEGTLRLGSKIGGNARILANMRLIGADVTVNRATATDPEGKFILDRVAGSVRINHVIPIERGERFRNLKTILVTPGQNLQLQLGGAGRPVVGSIAMPPGTTAKLDLTRDAHINASLKRPGRLKLWQKIPFPEDFPDRTPAEQEAWYTEFSKSPAGIAFLKDSQQDETAADFVISPDGSIRAEDVSAGEYQMQVIAYEPRGVPGPRQTRPQLLGLLKTTFKVEEGPQTDQPLDLGKLELQTPLKTEVGATFSLTKLVNMQGEPIKEEDFRGKVVLLSVWSMNQKPLFDAIKQVHEKFKENPRLAIINWGVNMLPAWEKRLGERAGLPGMLAMDQATYNGDDDNSLFMQLNLTGFPAIFVLDGDGRLLARDIKLDQIEAVVGKALGN